MPLQRPVDHDGAAVLAHHVDDLGAGQELGRRLLQPAMQQVEQHAATDAEPVRPGMQIGVGEVEHGAAAARLCLEPDDPATARDRLVREAERAQHREACRLKQKPRT